jgi:hypothetical protein
MTHDEKEALDSVEDLKKQLAKKLEVSDKRDVADIKSSRAELLSRAQPPLAGIQRRMVARAFTFLWPLAITEPSLRAMASMVRLSVREQRPRKTSATKSRNGLVVITTC